MTEALYALLLLALYIPLARLSINFPDEKVDEVVRVHMESDCYSDSESDGL